MAKGIANSIYYHTMSGPQGRSLPCAMLQCLAQIVAEIRNFILATTPLTCRGRVPAHMLHEARYARLVFPPACFPHIAERG